MLLFDTARRHAIVLLLFLLIVNTITQGTATAPSSAPTKSVVASPANVTFVKTIFRDDRFGYRDPSAPVFDGTRWHVWATKVVGDQGGYNGVVQHFFSSSSVLDSEWLDGGMALDTSSHGWDAYGVFTPSVAFEGAGGEAVPAPKATAWFLFFGGVSHPQPPYDESLGIATSSSPFGPWTKFEGNPIINGSNPQLKGLLWCDQGGPGPNPGVLHVDEAEPYLLHGQRKLYVKTVCRNHTVLPSVFRPVDPASWRPPYQYDTAIQQPIIPPNPATFGHGFEQARIYLGPDGLLHMTATSYAGFEPHFVSADNNFGVRWSLAEKMVDWGAPIHELTPVYPATAAGPPGDSGGVPQYFIQFDGSPFRLDLLKVHWGEVPALAP